MSPKISFIVRAAYEAGECSLEEMVTIAAAVEYCANEPKAQADLTERFGTMSRDCLASLMTKLDHHN